MKTIDSNAELRALTSAGAGYIFNDFGGPRDTSQNRDWNKLHRANCAECDPSRDHQAMTVQTQGQKLFFPTFRDAVSWLLENRSGNYTRCMRCNPR